MVYQFGIGHDCISRGNLENYFVTKKGKGENERKAKGMKRKRKGRKGEKRPTSQQKQVKYITKLRKEEIKKLSNISEKTGGIEGETSTDSHFFHGMLPALRLKNVRIRRNWGGNREGREAAGHLHMQRDACRDRRRQ